MDYKKHYDALIERAKLRNISVYTEKHHIIPRCLGGNNDKDNIVKLTPEEHFIAHQLLVKIYPNHDGLVWAAVQMTGHWNGKRSQNKFYGWLKRKYKKVSSSKIGNKNSSYGKPWYYDPITGNCGKFIENNQPEGWIKGRVSADSKITNCKVCNKKTNSSKAKWCDDCRPPREIKVKKELKLKDNYTREEKLEALRKHNNNIRQALFSLGLGDGGAHYRVMKELLHS
jgi:hypothetical protein